jgi:exodeoxyribonuclease-5
MLLSPDQRDAIDAIAAWLDRGESQRFVLGGLAGTGKTTILAHLLSGQCESDGLPADLNALVCSPTGKAAHVLRSKGIDDASTVHSLIYESRMTKSGWKHSLRESLPSCDLIVVDEASMLTRELVADIESFDLPVLYVGDHGQLEPVGDDPRIMHEPDVRLETIHRQAEGSPIIRFAHAVRARGQASESLCTASGVPFHSRIEPAIAFAADVMICAFRETRQRLNEYARKVRRLDGPNPRVGEPVICLANMAVPKGDGLSTGEPVFNGMTGVVLSVDTRRHRMVVQVDGRDAPLAVPYHWPQFGSIDTVNPHTVRNTSTLWDWAYAITAHKSQGSEWDNVVVYDECPPCWDGARWRYTAATRASKSLTWIKP